MKIYNLYNKFAITTFVVASLFTVSCNEDETLDRKGKPNLTLENKSISIDETQGASMTFNFDFAIKDASDLRIEVIGGTAEEGVDYTFNLSTMFNAGGGFYGGEGYYAQLPGYQTQYTLSNFISTVDDGVTEGNETIELRLFSSVKAGAIIDETFTINIGDFIPTTLDILLDIDGDITIDGNTVDKCNFDFDLYVSDSSTANSNVGHSWLGPVGDCNELFSLGLDDADTPGSENGLINNNPADWNDGTDYYIWIDLWDSSAAPAITAHVDNPLDLVFTKVNNGVSTDITIPLPALFKTDQVQSNGGAGTEGLKIAAKLEIAGNSYIITNLVTGDVTTL